jgi:hypothetical protein
MRWLPLLWLIPTLCAVAAERRIDGERIELAPGDTSSAFVIGVHGGEFIASRPARLSGSLTFESISASGPASSPTSRLTASIVARSLRGVMEDDWRKTQTIAGTRIDAKIDFPKAAFGSKAERLKWKIAGDNSDWNNFSVQWDGWLRILSDDIALATSSDDGSRVWLDLNGNDRVDEGEWGSNGWGNNQAATPTAVHRHLTPGLYHVRVQYEEGDGANSMRLLWTDAAHRVREDDGQADGPGERWYTVPEEGFTPGAVVTLRAENSALTIQGPLMGLGTVILGDGVHLANVPRGPQLTIAGQVTLAADLDLRQTSISFSSGGVLHLDGHALQLGALTGAGSIDVGHGALTLAPGSTKLDITGSGTLSTSGRLTLANLSPAVVVSAGTVQVGDRTVLQQALAAPLTTIITLSESAGGPQEITARISVPADAPPGLGVGAWRADRSGLWFQSLYRQRLTAGVNDIVLPLDQQAPLMAEGHGRSWNPTAAADTQRVGLFLYADVPSTARVHIDATVRSLSLPSASTPAASAPAASAPAASAPAARNRLTILDLEHFDGTSSHAQTGKRWSLSALPLPYPDAPCDPATYALDLTVVQPDGRVLTLAGFHDQPVTAIDDGNRETFTPKGPPRFQVRFRPSQSGRHRLRLTATRSGAPATVIELPDLEVSGQPWDGITRVDAEDPRFFSAGGAFVWPSGCNLNSTYDLRSKETLNTKVTVDRGSFTRGAFLERLAAGGGSGCETWLSPWNLGLEWTPGWPGFRGTGRYHDGHAWALDQFLDRAEELGVRVNLSLFNHGMARAGNGAEDDWKYHPYFRGNGGWLDTPDQLFTDERAFTAQKALFRYLGARYGDSPALLGWKLWAEVNLVHAPNEKVNAWHDRAAQALHARDPYQHPITSHWCGDWTAVNRTIAGFASIDYLTIDAYHGDGTAIAELLNQSTRDPLKKQLGLAKLGKPILVTEFGGHAWACSRERMRAELAIGPWAGFVSGHAGAPMLWWFEWIDQEDRFGVYGALAKFTRGEDLRGKNAGSSLFGVGT